MKQPNLQEIKEMKKQQKTAPAGTYIEGVKLYTFEETAQVLNVSKRTVQNYYWQDKIKGRKIGRRIYILAESIASFARGEIWE